MNRLQKRETLRQRLLTIIQHQGEGAKLPPERELSERFGVARETLRRCLEELAQEGRLMRRQGSGTFVALQSQPWIKPFALRSFSEDMRNRGLVPSSRIIAIAEVQAAAKEAQKFRVVPGSLLFEIRRLRLADGDPMALETAYLVKERLPGFDAQRLAQESLYEILEREYQIEIHSASQQIEATVLTNEEARWLDVAPFSPALVVERHVICTSGEAIEYGKSLYRADRYRFEVDVMRASEMRPAQARWPDGRAEGGR